MKKLTFISLAVVLLLVSCVSQQKYTELEGRLSQTQTELQKTVAEKETLQKEYTSIENRVTEFKNKLRVLKSISENQMVSVDDVVVMSNNQKKRMRETLKNVDQAKLAKAKTVTDSMNLAISYNLKKTISDGNDDIDVNIEETVVVINISDEFLFRTASYKLSKKSNSVLSKLAKVLNQQPGMEVLVEGHTDSRSIRTEMFRDNWDLSVKRAASVVEVLQNKFHVDPTRLIAAGRSSYKPIAPNDSKADMAKNRRTRIVILPELDKFFALLNP